MTLATTEEIITELRAGRMVILVDEEDRENEGDLVMAADFVNAEAINFMSKHGRGLICLTLTQQRCQQLNLPLMTQKNGTQYGTAFTLSIEAAEGVTTGISAADRARTVQAAIARDARPNDIVQPGHIFPIMAQPGGVLVRSGHTEAGCDLASMAGCTPAAVICEIMNDDGSMARLPELIPFGQQHGLKIGTIADLIHYRSRTESIVERVSARTMQTPWGLFQAVTYRDKPSGNAHLALINGTPVHDLETLVRVHEPLSVLDLLETGTTVHSWSVGAALQEIADAERGVMVLLNCCSSAAEVGAAGFFRQFSEQDPLHPAADLPHRGRPNFCTYGIGAQILKDVGVGKMRVLASVKRIPTIGGYDLEVTGCKAMNQSD